MIQQKFTKIPFQRIIGSSLFEKFVTVFFTVCRNDELKGLAFASVFLATPSILLTHIITSPWRDKYKSLLNNAEVTNTSNGNKTTIGQLVGCAALEVKKLPDGKAALFFSAVEKNGPLGNYNSYYLLCTQNHLSVILVMQHLNFAYINRVPHEIDEAINFIKNELACKAAIKIGLTTKYLMQSPIYDNNDNKLLALIYSNVGLANNKEEELVKKSFLQPPQDKNCLSVEEEESIDSSLPLQRKSM
jgi:hypothetical protein